MDITSYLAIASMISALCALLTLYMYREQGRGFVWTKDPKVIVIFNDKDEIHLEVEIPLLNFGKGNIRFLELKAKTINLETKGMQNFNIDMDEAYFPQGSPIISFKAALTTFLDVKKGSFQFVRVSNDIPATDNTKNIKEHGEQMNKQIQGIPEYIVILKCIYKDGSWFGFGRKNTVIGLSVKDTNVNYLTIQRRKELKEYFAW